MSARVSTATPQRPTSPSRHRVVGVEAEQRRHVERRRQAVAAGRMISLKRQLVSSAVPKPANIRIVHSFDRYIDAYGPAGVGVHARELAVVRARTPARAGCPTWSRSRRPATADSALERPLPLRHVRGHPSRTYKIRNGAPRGREIADCHELQQVPRQPYWDGRRSTWRRPTSCSPRRERCASARPHPYRPRELVLDCIGIATQAPAGGNMQRWRWVVVDDPAAAGRHRRPVPPGLRALHRRAEGGVEKAGRSDSSTWASSTRRRSWPSTSPRCRCTSSRARSTGCRPTPSRA